LSREVLWLHLDEEQWRSTGDEVAGAMYGLDLGTLDVEFD